MYVGTVIARIEIPDAYSLKDKRQVVRSVTDRLRSRFNASVAEVGDPDVWNVADIGVAVVCGAYGPIKRTFEQIERFFYEDYRFQCVAFEQDIVQEEGIYGI